MNKYGKLNKESKVFVQGGVKYLEREEPPVGLADVIYVALPVLLVVLAVFFLIK